MVRELSQHLLGWGLRCHRWAGCIWGSGDDEAGTPTLTLLASRGTRGKDLAESSTAGAKALPRVPGGRGWRAWERREKQWAKWGQATGSPQAHPGHQASRLSLCTWAFATCDVCSINTLDFLDLRWLARTSAVPPPPSQRLQSQLLFCRGRGSTEGV